jgi:hypothetical protein
MLMYQRDIFNPRSSPIENGVPIAGTWTQAFEDVNFLNIRRPFSWPTPKWMRDIRIKEWQSFIVQDDNFFLKTALINLKYFRTALVYLYDKKTQEHLKFRKYLPFGSWHLPKELCNSSVTSRSYGFFFRIHDWLDAGLIKVDLDIEATKSRPSFTAHLEFDLNENKTTSMVTTLLFAEKRPLYSYKGFSSVRGNMVFGGQNVFLDPSRAMGMFADYKGFYPYRMISTWCTAFGFDSENRIFGFSLAENQAKEPYKNNENVLWLDGKMTPLPPVRITMPEGKDSDWVIQDLEGMVDLTFTPVEKNRQSFGIVLSRAEHHSLLGYYNGVLVNSEEEAIQVRNLWGLGEDIYLRI